MTGKKRPQLLAQMPPSCGRFSDLHVDCSLCPVHIGRNLRSVAVCPTYTWTQCRRLAGTGRAGYRVTVLGTNEKYWTQCSPPLADPSGLLPRRARAPSDRARAKPGV